MGGEETRVAGEGGGGGCEGGGFEKGGGCEEGRSVS